MKNLNKKAMSEEQFRWIFILIAGAMIMGFFGSIVVKQKQAQEDNTAAAELQNIEFLMANAKVATGSSEEVELFKEIKFDCDSFKIGSASKQTKEAIFAPQLLKGRNLITWTLNWDTPYRAANFLFLTTDEVRYVFVYDENRYNADNSYKNFFDEVYNKISNKINKERISNEKNIQDKNNYKVRLVLFDLDIAPTALKGDVSKLKIEGISSESDLEKGRISFDNQKSHYLELPSLYAAIFSENKIDYECAMGKAFRKLNLVSQVYDKKLEGFNTNVQNTDCIAIYSVAKDRINKKMFGAILEKKEEAYAAARDIEKYNTDLIKASCPPIY